MMKRVRRMHDRRLRWEHESFAEKDRITAAMERELSGIDVASAGDIEGKMLRELLYGAFAALSYPRAKPVFHGGGVPMRLQDAEQLQMAAALQKRVRRILLEGLIVWRKQMNLEDIQIEPILVALRSQIERFERCTSMEVKQACGGTQWAKLKNAIWDEEEETDLPRVPSRTGVNAGSRAAIIGQVYTPHEKIRQLAAVRQREPGVTLKCNACGFEINSSWYVKDKDGVEKVLRPHNGHAACG